MIASPAVSVLAERLAPHAASPDAAAVKQARLREAATQFEALFLSMIVKEMTAGLTSLFGEEAGADVYRGLFETSLGQALAGKGFGLAATIEHAFDRSSEAGASASTPGTFPSSLESALETIKTSGAASAFVPSLALPIREKP